MKRKYNQQTISMTLVESPPHVVASFFQKRPGSHLTPVQRSTWEKKPAIHPGRFSRRVHLRIRRGKSSEPKHPFSGSNCSSLWVYIYFPWVGAQKSPIKNTVGFLQFFWGKKKNTGGPHCQSLESSTGGLMKSVLICIGNSKVLGQACSFTQSTESS